MSNLHKVPERHRKAVLERLSNALLEMGDDAPEVASAVDIVCLIAGTLEVDERRCLAERFAHAKNAPRRLIAHFAQDLYFIAEPVLRWSNRVDADLVAAIAEHVSADHLKALAQRADLSAEGCETLAMRGGPEIHRALALNGAVVLSAAALQILLRSAARSPAVEDALAGREDLPGEVADQLMRRVCRRLREEVGPIADSLDPPALRLALRTGDTDASPRDSDTQGLSLDVFVTIARLARAQRLRPEHLAEYIKKRNVGAVIATFANLANIQPTQARRLVLQPSGEALAVAARAANLGPEVFAGLSALRRDMHLTDQDLAGHEGTFSAVTVDTARTIMSFHSRRSRGQRRAVAKAS